MARNTTLDHYEDLLAFTEEIRESMDIIHRWLSISPDLDKPATYYDLITAHSAHFALLNLIMYRLDSLVAEHREIIQMKINEK